MATTLFHVTAAANRASIARHGLDSGRMGAIPGVAGSPAPEGEGVFLARDLDEVAFFVAMGSRYGGEVDVWEVTVDAALDDAGDPVGPGPLVETPDGFLCHLGPIPPERLGLRPPEPRG